MTSGMFVATACCIVEQRAYITPGATVLNPTELLRPGRTLISVKHRTDTRYPLTCISCVSREFTMRRVKANTGILSLVLETDGRGDGAYVFIMLVSSSLC